MYNFTDSIFASFDNTALDISTEKCVRWNYHTINDACHASSSARRDKKNDMSHPPLFLHFTATRSLFYFWATMADINLWIIYKLTVKRTAVHTRFSAQIRSMFFPKNNWNFRQKILRRYIHTAYFESDKLNFILLFVL